jgi:hypothetical protein
VAPAFYEDPATWNAFPEPSTVGQPFRVEVSFIDWDISYTCTIDYGDGTGPQAGTLPYLPWEKVCVGPDHVYTAPGSYTVTAAVTDSDGSTGTGTYVHRVEATTQPSIHVSFVQITYKKAGKLFTFTGNVTILDASDQPVNKATVNTLWTLADGSTLAKSASTNKAGVATILGPKGDEGTYTLCVTNVTNAGMVFTPGANDCASATVPGTTATSSEFSAVFQVEEVYLPLITH